MHMVCQSAIVEPWSKNPASANSKGASVFFMQCKLETRTRPSWLSRGVNLQAESTRVAGINTPCFSRLNDECQPIRIEHALYMCSSSAQNAPHTFV